MFHQIKQIELAFIHVIKNFFLFLSTKISFTSKNCFDNITTLFLYFTHHFLLNLFKVIFYIFNINYIKTTVVDKITLCYYTIGDEYN